MAKKTNGQTEQTEQVDQVEQLRQDIITNKEENTAQTPKTKPKMVRAAKPENDPPSFSSVSTLEVPQEQSHVLMSIFGNDDADIVRLDGDTLLLKRNSEKPSIVFGIGR